MKNYEQAETTGEGGDKTSPWDKLKEVVFGSGKPVQAEQKTTEAEQKELTPEERIDYDITKEIDDIRDQISEKEAKLRELEDSSEHEGEAIGYREVGGDVYNIRQEPSKKDHEAALSLAREIGELNSQQQYLSNPQTREAEINKRIKAEKEAEEKNEAYNAAMLSGWNNQYGFQRKLDWYNQRIFELKEAGKKEAADEVRAQKQKYIDEEIIPVGQRVLMSRKEREENSEKTENSFTDTATTIEQTTESPNSAESKNETKEKTQCEKYREAAIAFARNITVDNAKKTLWNDQFKLKDLNQWINRYEEHLYDAETSQREKQRYRNKIKELKAEVIEKYGDHDTSYYKNANSTTISGTSDAILYGRKRAVDWSIVDRWLNGDDKRQVKKALKEKGYNPKEFPTAWDDESFSAKQIADMREIVERKMTGGFKDEKSTFPNYSEAMMSEKDLNPLTV